MHSTVHVIYFNYVFLSCIYYVFSFWYGVCYYHNREIV